MRCRPSTFIVRMRCPRWIPIEFLARSIGIVRGGLPEDRAARPAGTAGGEGRVGGHPGFGGGLGGVGGGGAGGGRPADTAEVEGRVEVHPEFADGLDGIEGFSHVFLLAYFHKVPDDARGLLKVKPRRLLREGASLVWIPTLGVFATDSPARPNSIGLTLVKLVARDGNVLVVKGLDLFDRTPPIHIKPYRTDYKVETHWVPMWSSKYDAERKPL